MSASAAAAPQPGARLPAPDPELRLLQQFVNTNDIEGGSDELGDPDSAASWLARHGLIRAGTALSAADHARIVEFREGLRSLGLANNGGSVDRSVRAAFNRLVGEVALVGALDEDGRFRLRGTGRGAEAVIGRLLETLVRSMADGSWSRLKACRMHSCRWLFWDASRNRSGTWCTMAICGSREKARGYRARRRAAAS